VGGNFTYSDYSFIGNTQGILAPDFKTETGTVNYEHKFTRRLTVSAAAGPQWTTEELGTYSTSLGVFVDVSASYKGEQSGSTLSFVRTTNAGYGVVGGGLSNSVAYSGTKTLARVWTGAVLASYTDTTSLATPLQPEQQFHTAVVGVQVSRALPHSLSCFASYSLQSQSGHGPFLTVLNAFSGHYQSLGLGLTYAPRAIHFGGH
jgi:glutamate dehydrogenase/leucine dehydrogenase